MTPDLVLCSRRVVTPGRVGPAAVWLVGGRIARVTALHERPAGGAVEDLGDLALLPGVVDTHVHLNDPGRTDWEGFATGTQAAAAGGVTTVVDMPLNCVPATTTAAALADKLAAACGRLWVDCGFWGGLVAGNADRMHELADAGVLGFKAFLCPSGVDEFPAAGSADLVAAMPAIAACGRPLLVHAELLDDDVPPIRNPRRFADFMATRPPRFECRAIQLLADLCGRFACRTHVVHLATAEALDDLVLARACGFPLTVETCPHYLTFAAEEIPDGQPIYKCTPPIRGRANRERLWDALRGGHIDLVASDHSPAPPQVKQLDAGDLARAWGGIASLQVSLPATWMAAQARGFGLGDVARWMSTAPAALAGLAGLKGAIAPGADADLVVFDPEAEVVVESASLRTRWPISPYVGRRLHGVVRRTYLRGAVVFDGQAVASSPAGRALRRGRDGQILMGDAR